MTHRRSDMGLDSAAARPESNAGDPRALIGTLLTSERFNGAFVPASGGFPPGCERVTVAPDGSAGLDWAASGAMALTGSEEGPPRRLLSGLASRLNGAAAAFEMVTAVAGRRVRIDGPALLGERAALQGLGRRGRTTVGGAGRLIEAGDGWIAVNLPRRRDLELLEAWLGGPVSDDPWMAVQVAASRTERDAIIARGRELGLAVALVASPREAFGDGQALFRAQSFPPAPWVIDGSPRRPEEVHRSAGASTGRRLSRRRPPLVLDLSSLWAGPLCASLVLAAGARVIKVETRQRPDGTRGTGLFDLLNAGKECIALDFRHDEDRLSLGRLLEAADIVIEGFRPRVMESLGIFPDAWLDQGEGRVWLSISGYGRTGPGRNWIAFGDDAAVAGGAITVVEGFEDSPVFCGDAIADPVGGLYAAIAVMAAWNSGLGHVIDVALREAIGHAVGGPELDPGEEPRVVPSAVGGSEWALLTSEGLREIAGPRARMASSKGSAIDEDGRRLRTEFSL